MSDWRIPHFDGAEYDPAQDYHRLAKQYEVILAFMLRQSPERWFTVQELAVKLEALGTQHQFPENSIQAQLRNFRKKRYGSYMVEKRRRAGFGSGTWEYRVLEPVEPVEPVEDFPDYEQEALFGE